MATSLVEIKRKNQVIVALKPAVDPATLAHKSIPELPDWRRIQETLGRVNKSVASVLERALAIDRVGYHDEDTRMKYWAARFAVVRGVVDRAKERGELRDGINPLAGLQLVVFLAVGTFQREERNRHRPASAVGGRERNEQKTVVRHANLE